MCDIGVNCDLNIHSPLHSRVQNQRLPLMFPKILILTFAIVWQGNVYVKCPTIPVAMAVVGALHGRWFAGKPVPFSPIYRSFLFIKCLVLLSMTLIALSFPLTGKMITAAYVPLPTYHNLFPDAATATELLRPMNRWSTEWPLTPLHLDPYAYPTTPSQMNRGSPVMEGHLTYEVRFHSWTVFSYCILAGVLFCS